MAAVPDAVAPSTTEAAAADSGRTALGAVDTAPRQGSAVLTIGFGTTVAMWTIGYITHLPTVVDLVPPWLVGVGLITALAAGGFITGRYSVTARLALRNGGLMGLLTALLNMAIFSSLIYSDHAENVPSPAIWIPGYFIASAIFAAALSRIGWSWVLPIETRREINWVWRHGAVTVLATVLLVIAGGLVTGLDAGLSVPDWPSSFGTNMFLYPLSKMTGPIYFEHAHRLYGALVGLCTIAFAAHLAIARHSRQMIVLGVIAVIAVALQGYMGGRRVSMANTGDGIPVAGAEHETLASQILRVAHGAFGQVFLAFMVALAVLAAYRFGRRAGQRLRSVSAETDRQLAVILLTAIIIQLVLGAVLRHLSTLMYVHVTFAGIVGLLMIASGVRLWGIYGRDSVTFRRLGWALLLLLPTQIVLGFATLALVGPEPLSTPATPLNVTLSTAHQAVGAVILATAAAAATLAWVRLEPVRLPALDRAEPGKSAATSGDGRLGASA